MNPIGIIFTGGPNSVYLDTSPQVDPEIFTWGVPILGICYGCQLMAHNLGGLVTPAQEDTAREYGKTVTYYDTSCRLFQDLPEQGISWMSHGDYMAKVPDGFALVGHTDMCPNAAIADEVRGFYGVQVSSGGQPHGKRPGHDPQLPLCRLSRQGRLDHGRLLPHSHRLHSGKGRRR